MHDDHAATANSYDLRGWRMHFVFDTARLNALCERYYAGRSDETWAGNETLDFFHQRPSGWLTTRCVLGYPLLQFPTGSSEKISVARRFVSYASYEFQRGLGEPYADILEVVAASQNERRALFQQFRLDQCVGTYKYGGKPMFTLTADSDFSVGFFGREARDTDAGLPFKIRFDNLPADKKVVVLPVEEQVAGGEWLIKDLRFYPRKVTGQSSHILYIANAGDGNGSIPASSADALPAIDAAAAASCYVDIRNIPAAGYYGRDFEQLAQMLFPRRYTRFTELYQSDLPYDFIGEARLVDAISHRAPEAATDAALYGSHVSPLVRVVSAGSEKQQLNLNTVNPGTPVWRFESTGSGKLEPDGFYCRYTPVGEGAVVYQKSPVTRKEAALSTTLSRKPVEIDRIIAGFGLIPYFSTMVVFNARPTHYFKLTASGKNIQLTFCYEGWDGEEVVAPDDTEWKVLAGDGKMSQSGLFTPGTINKFSVVQAIQTTYPGYMHFAAIVIPVPLLSAAEFVAMRNGG